MPVTSATAAVRSTTRHPTPLFHAGTKPVANAPKDGFEGFGAEFNPYLFLNRPGTADEIAKKTGALNPHDVRIFVPWEVVNYSKAVATLGKEKADRIVESFYASAALAVKKGANLNLTFNGLMTNNGKLGPEAWAKHRDWMVDRFAGVVNELTARNGGKPVPRLHLTFDNEPSGTHEFAAAKQSGHVATFAKRYAEGYAALDARLKADGRSDVKLVAGDVTAENREQFLCALKGTGIEQHIDAWSFHVYPRLHEPLEAGVKRLQNIRALAAKLGLTKPLTINELGVKGYGPWVKTKNGLMTPPGNPGRTEPYTLKRDANGKVVFDAKGKPVSVPHGRPVEQTGRGAFRQGWYALAAARLGFQGAIKWEAFDGGKHGGYAPGEFAMIGADGKHTTPSYSLFRIFDGAVPPGWQAMRGSGAQRDERATFFRGPGGGLSALAMNQGERAEPFRADGFPKGAKVHVAIWTPDGRVRYATATAAGGKVSIPIPPGGAIAVSTVPFLE